MDAVLSGLLLGSDLESVDGRLSTTWFTERRRWTTCILETTSETAGRVAASGRCRGGFLVGQSHDAQRRGADADVNEPIELIDAGRQPWTTGTLGHTARMDMQQDGDTTIFGPFAALVESD